MIILLRKNNVLDQEKLTKFENDTVKANKFSKEVSLIAKNQQGLKELFQFVSLGLTDNFFKSPKVYLETLENRENVLLGSGALKSRLVDKMLFSSKDVVAKEISRYDYIEIQPLKNFSHIIKRGFKKEDLIDMIKFVINESKKQGKIIVATGDVRYLDEKEKVYHNVFINAKGLGGVRHYLYKYEEESPDYPIQNILTTNEMIEEFNFLDDINLIHEIVIENTNKIANMIDDNIQVIKSELYTPKLKDSDQNLKELVYKNAQKKYGQNLQPIIKNRIEKELKSIIQHGYAVIY
jgi:DNA polymerase-3 subunit alpha (Gram-positive type)